MMCNEHMLAPLAYSELLSPELGCKFEYVKSDSIRDICRFIYIHVLIIVDDVCPCTYTHIIRHIYTTLNLGLVIFIGLSLNIQIIYIYYIL